MVVSVSTSHFGQSLHFSTGVNLTLSIGVNVTVNIGVNITPFIHAVVKWGGIGDKEVARK